MRLFDLIALLFVLAAAFSYLNFKVLKLPATIGLMALSLVLSLSILLVGSIYPEVSRQAKAVADQLNLNEALLHGMLGFLLFAGALQIDLDDLKRHCGPIAVLATVGVVLSTLIVGSLMWLGFGVLGFQVRLIDCMLFGALISPTDPIAVLALLKKIGAPKFLEVQIAGESLFNDGVGVALFLGLLEVATGDHAFQVSHLVRLFLQEAVGGAAFGLVVGLIAFRLIKSVDNYQVEILLSLALAAGGYSGAEALHLSGPIAVVVAGMLIGNQGRAYAMSATTNEHLDLFWELVDDVLNAVLFVTIGLHVMVLDFTPTRFAAGVLAVVAVLTARVVAVGLPVWLLRRWERFVPRMVPILTWGGLRGGISVALALSIPASGTSGGVSGREVILVATYVVVVFSILVQGLTVGWVTRRLIKRTGFDRPGAGALTESVPVSPPSAV